METHELIQRGARLLQGNPDILQGPGRLDAGIACALERSVLVLRQHQRRVDERSLLHHDRLRHAGRGVAADRTELDAGCGARILRGLFETWRGSQPGAVQRRRKRQRRGDDEKHPEHKPGCRHWRRVSHGQSLPGCVRSRPRGPSTQGAGSRSPVRRWTRGSRPCSWFEIAAGRDVYGPEHEEQQGQADKNEIQHDFPLASLRTRTRSR